jgi:hypothetical protein
MRDASDYYREKAKEAADAMGGVINRAADAFRDAFKAAASMGDAGPGASAPPPPPPPSEPPVGGEAQS